MSEPVTYRNTKTGRVTRLAEASPLMDRSTRWVRVLGDVYEPGAGAEGEGAAPAPFHPSGHTVAEVNEYLADGGTGTEDRARVIKAEEAGRNRRGIIQGPYADLSEQE